MVLPRALASAPTGMAVTLVGWEGFFIFCSLAAVPGLLVLRRVAPRRGARAAAESAEPTRG
jgi:PAT family beta-lactamase induction signal transducer AmpG